MGTILVTGAAGFIGSHVCQALLEQGDRVIAVDDFNNFYSPQYKQRNIVSFKDHPRFRLFRVDVADFSAMEKIFVTQQIDQVCHLAARAGIRASQNEPHLYHRTNIQGTLNLFELGREFSVSHFVIASSSSVYGQNSQIPFVEDQCIFCPSSIYAATKCHNELLAHSYCHLYDINVTVLRFFTIYGPRGRPDMVPYKFVDRIYRGIPIDMYGDGTSCRDYTFISDAVNGIGLALHRRFKYEVLNIGSSQQVKLADVITSIEHLLDRKATVIQKPLPKSDLLITLADLTKSRQMLGYQPTTPFKHGLALFIDWYLDRCRDGYVNSVKADDGPGPSCMY